MTRNEICSALVAAGISSFLVREYEWEFSRDANELHISFYDLEKANAPKIRALVKKLGSDAQHTDKGINFVAKAR